MRGPGRILLALCVALLLGASPVVEEAIDRGDRAFGDGDLAGALVQWSVGLEQARTDEDLAAVVELSLRLAAAHRELGRLATAELVLGTAQTAAAGDPLAEARILVARGQLALVAGDPRAAEKLFHTAFTEHRDHADPAGAATAATNLGVARLALGRHAEARKAFTGAASLFRSLADPKGEADALTNLGVTDLRDGQYASARSHLEKAIALFREAGDAAGEADASTNLARVHEELGQVESAEELYRAALRVARARKDVPRQATLLLDLGALAQRAGRSADAERHYSAAEEAFLAAERPADALAVALNRATLPDAPASALRSVFERAADGGWQRVEAMAALDLAARVRSTDPREAGKLADRAAHLAEDLELTAVRWRARTLSGQLDLDAGRTKQGIASLREAVDLLERTRRALDKEEAHRFALGHEEVYQSLIDALLADGDDLGAFVYSQRLQLTELPGVPVSEEDPDYLRYAELQSEEAYVTRELSAHLTGGGDDEQAAALRERLATLRVEFAGAVDTLRASHPHFDELVRVDPEDLEAIQAELEPGVVVLQPVLLEDRLALLVFRNDRLVARTIEVDGAEVEKMVSRLARLLRMGSASHAEMVTSLAETLGEWIIAPIADDLQGASVLVVSVSGPFRQLPFALLRHDGRYLVQDLAVVGVTHVGSLRKRAATEARFQIDGPSLLLVGNPDGTLPNAEAEVGAIAERFPGATVLVGAAGTESALQDAAPKKLAVHLATHGMIDPRFPDRSYLVLADSGDEGRLSYREIPGLAPYLGSCRLVVLSACESGLPVEGQGSGEEGELVISINGLAAQFRRAGVETLVASLWKVDDSGTRELMVRFYDELGSGRDVASALHTAQLALLEDETYAHPWYWAGFVVMGDWR